MPNIVVTSTANCINVVFNDMAAFTGYEKANFNKQQITFQLTTGDHCVRVFDKYGVPWCVTYPTNPELLTGLEAVIIDSVDGTLATSNDQLYELLIATKG